MHNNSNLSEQENGNIYRILIEESPAPFALFTGREMVIKQINKAMLKAWGKDASVIGKTYYESLPELADQPYYKMLDDVYTTGIAYSAMEDKVELMIDGTLQTFYFNLTLKPLKNADDNVWGIINTVADVTELVLTRQKLLAFDERTKFIIDSAELGTWDIDRVADVIVWNNRCRRLYGFADGEAVSITNVRKNVHPDDSERITASVIKTTLPTSDGNYDETFRIVYDEDKVRWIKCKGKAYFNGNRQCVRFAGTALDITADVKSREQQQILAALVENTHDSIGVVGLNAEMLYANKATYRIFGLDSTKSFSGFSYDYFMPGDGERLKNVVIPEVMKTGRWDGELNYRDLITGEPIPMHLNIFRIDDPVTGKPMARASVARDIRPDKKALAELLYLSEQLRSTNIEINEQVKQYEFVTGFMPVQLWTAKTNGELDYVNQRAMDYFGLPSESLMGTAWLSFVHPDDTAFAVECWLHSLKTHEPYQVEFRIKNKNGIYKWHLVRALPFMINAEVVKWFGTNTDIDDQKQLQQQKDDFLGIASHELKTPVTSIKAYAQVLGAMLTKEGETKKAEMVLRMDAQVNRLTNLIGDLLDVTKINSGRLQFNKTWFDFNQVIKENVDDLQHTTDKHTLIQDFENTGKVYSDKDRIGQVITNLITNAIKYSPHADKIIITTRLNQQEVTVCVQDFGIGIPGDKADKVFEQFYRVSGTKQHTFPGLGLGLYISSEIVKREGGRIWVNSVEGKGSTFCFALPVNDNATNIK